MEEHVTGEYKSTIALKRTKLNELIEIKKNQRGMQIDPSRAANRRLYNGGGGA